MVLVTNVFQVSLHQPGRLLLQLQTFVGGIKLQILGRNRFVPGVDKTLHNAARV